MRIAITGGTGLLGRNLLFEILKTNLNHLNGIEIIIFGRRGRANSFRERIREMLLSDGFDYIGISQKDYSEVLNFIEKQLILIEFDLTKEDLSISAQDLKKLKDMPIDYFFHAAAVSDFRSTAVIEAKVFEVNLSGTMRVLRLIEQLMVGEFIYTGSAYCAGYARGEISPDYINKTGKFRNPYEKSKLETELYLKAFAKARDLKYKIFRLTGIGGRLIESPIGSVSKYDIFYGWALFFLKHKFKSIEKLEKIYELPLELPIRIALNFEAGMNVVPVDYAVKLMLAACIHHDKHVCYHLVNDVDIPNALSVKLMLDALNIKGWSLVNKIPENKNQMEELYYKTVGSIFTPYLISEPIHYNYDNIIGLRDKIGISCPPMDEGNFIKLIDYAKRKYFGAIRN